MPNVRQKFDPLDLEIVERVYEVGCAYLAAEDLYEDVKRHAEEVATLGKLLRLASVPVTMNLATLPNLRSAA